MMNRRAFTLVELVIYLAILALLSTSLVMFSISTSSARAQGRIAEEVNASGRFALDMISQKIRAATIITSPLPGAQNSVLALTMQVPQPNSAVLILAPTLYYLDSLVGLQSLTTNNVRAESVLFENVTPAGSIERDVIRVTLTLLYKSDPKIDQFTYRKTFVTTVATRL